MEWQMGRLILGTVKGVHEEQKMVSLLEWTSELGTFF